MAELNSLQQKICEGGKVILSGVHYIDKTIFVPFDCKLISIAATIYGPRKGPAFFVMAEKFTLNGFVLDSSGKSFRFLLMPKSKVSMANNVIECFISMGYVT